MAAMLFVHARDSFARASYSDAGVPYWSRAFPAVLEQHGFLDVDVADSRILATADTFERYAVIAFAPLPEAAWTPEVIARVLTGNAHVYIDGRTPTAISRALGVESAGTTQAAGRLLAASGGALRSYAEPYGIAPEAHIGGCTSREVLRTPDFEWSSFPEIGIEERRAAAWRRLSWSAERWLANDAVEVLADWLPAGEAAWSPAIVRSGNVTASAIGLIEYTSQWHTSQPFLPGEFRSCAPSVGAEVLLLSLFDDLHARAGATRARILPWPGGSGWALNVRHDFDRWLTKDQVAAVVERHRHAGSSATWYWRASHLRKPLLGGRLGPLADPSGNRIARWVSGQPRHEVALHTEQLWAARNAAELRLLETAIGKPARGTTAHGGERYFRFQGAPNVLWAERYGLAYTELIERAHLHPHRFVALDEDGLARPMHIICMPKHQSLDRSTKPEDHLKDEILAGAATWQRASGLLQVMNHPDVHQDELFEVLNSLPRKGRLDLTAAEAVDWWRRSHVRDELELVVTGSGDVRARSRHGVSDLRVELALPDGSRRVVTVDAAADSYVGLRAPTT